MYKHFKEYPYGILWITPEDSHQKTVGFIIRSARLINGSLTIPFDNELKGTDGIHGDLDLYLPDIQIILKSTDIGRYRTRDDLIKALYFDDADTESNSFSSREEKRINLLRLCYHGYADHLLSGNKIKNARFELYDDSDTLCLKLEVSNGGKE